MVATVIVAATVLPSHPVIYPAAADSAAPLCRRSNEPCSTTPFWSDPFSNANKNSRLQFFLSLLSMGLLVVVVTSDLVGPRPILMLVADLVLAFTSIYVFVFTSFLDAGNSIITVFVFCTFLNLECEI
jgi:hypothetical protein